MLKRTKINASAKVVDGTLIISLPDAKNPVVWRMALGDARAAAIEVVPRKNEHVLILKTAKGEATDIAPFGTREAATDALMTISHAMEQSAGDSRQARAPRDGSAWKWVIPLAFILGALFFFSQTARMTSSINTASPTFTTDGGAGDVGVPLSADRYLGGL